MEPASSGIVDIKMMALILKVSPDTVRRLVATGGIPAFRVGRLWRFDSAAVLAHLSQPRDPWAQSSQSRSRKRRP